MPNSPHVLPPAFPHPSSRYKREHEPFTLDDLARVLRGVPRNAGFWVNTPTGLRPVVGITATQVRTGEIGPAEASTAGAYGLVLSLGPPPQAEGPGTAAVPISQQRGSLVENRYRTVLQAIARGRSNSGTAVSRIEAQQLAREALLEMGDDWTKRGTAVANADGAAAVNPLAGAGG